jgi:hypothetical protein
LRIHIGKKTVLNIPSGFLALNGIETERPLRGAKITGGVIPAKIIPLFYIAPVKNSCSCLIPEF